MHTIIRYTKLFIYLSKPDFVVVRMVCRLNCTA